MRKRPTVEAETTVFCRTCGYTLNHLPPGDCPECGQLFDADDLRTVSLSKPFFARNLVNAVFRYGKWVIWALAVLFCLFGLISALILFIQGVSGNAG